MEDLAYIYEFMEYLDSINYAGYGEELLTLSPEYFMGEYEKFIDNSFSNLKTQTHANY